MTCWSLSWETGRSTTTFRVPSSDTADGCLRWPPSRRRGLGQLPEHPGGRWEPGGRSGGPAGGGADQGSALRARPGGAAAPYMGMATAAGARAGRRLEPGRGPAGGGAARGAEADKERSPPPNMAVGAGGFHNRSGREAGWELWEPLRIQGVSAGERGSRARPWPPVIPCQQSWGARAVSVMCARVSESPLSIFVYGGGVFGNPVVQ